MLKIDSVTIDADREPPRPALPPRQRVQSLHPAIGDLSEYTEDWGLMDSVLVRFVSSGTQGFLNRTQVIALRSLYEAGTAFELTTDLLDDLGIEAVTYIARFDPGSPPPQFTPATPGGVEYFMDMVLRVALGDEGGEGEG